LEIEREKERESEKERERERERLEGNVWTEDELTQKQTLVAETGLQTDGDLDLLPSLCAYFQREIN
jgi:hypothetical protein